MPYPIEDSLEQAVAIVAQKYDAAELDAIEKDPKKAPLIGDAAWKRVGALTVFTEAEERQVVSLEALFKRYLAQNKLDRPLCVAVFGPPGSGKSLGVKQIRKEAFHGTGLNASMTTINLTQVNDQADLGDAVVQALMAAMQEKQAIPLIFFDEFDATRDGAAYGWLGWFLAPMQDGVFLHRGRTVKVGKAILVLQGEPPPRWMNFPAARANLTSGRPKAAISSAASGVT